MGMGDYILIAFVCLFVISSLIEIYDSVSSWIERKFFPEKIVARQEETLAYLEQLLEEYKKKID